MDAEADGAGCYLACIRRRLLVAARLPRIAVVVVCSTRWVDVGLRSARVLPFPAVPLPQHLLAAPVVTLAAAVEQRQSSPAAPVATELIRLL